MYELALPGNLQSRKISDYSPPPPQPPFLKKKAPPLSPPPFSFSPPSPSLQNKKISGPPPPPHNLPFVKISALLLTAPLFSSASLPLFRESYHEGKKRDNVFSDRDKENQRQRKN